MTAPGDGRPAPPDGATTVGGEVEVPWHHMPVRVYWEDTDAGGIVYYANYLKFAERARTEMVRATAGDQTAILERHGVVFAVRRVEADYRAPASLDDLLDVATRITDISGARVTLTQEVRRGGEVLVRLVVVLAALDRQRQPARIPTEIRGLLGPLSRPAVVPPD